MIRAYNRLEGEAKEFVVSRRMSRADYTVPVKGRRKPMSGDSSLTLSAGDGTWGFGTRRNKRDKVRITEGQDGQYLRKKGSVARKRKNVCRLASKKVLGASQEHPQARLARLKREERIRRGRNRNRAATEGRKRK